MGRCEQKILLVPKIIPPLPSRPCIMVWRRCIGVRIRYFFGLYPGLLSFLRIRILLFSSVAVKIKFKTVNLPTMSNKQKNFKKIDFMVIFVITEEKSKIRICNLVVRIPEYGIRVKKLRIQSTGFEGRWLVHHIYVK